MSDSWTPACHNCRFWLVFPAEAQRPQKDGICRRHPPVLSSDVRSAASPITIPDAWCGEHEPLRSELGS